MVFKIIVNSLYFALFPSRQKLSMRAKKATYDDDDDVPGDVLKLLGEDDLKLINNIYESGECRMVFTEVTMCSFKKQPKAIKCSNHSTISLFAHTAKMVAIILCCMHRASSYNMYINQQDAQNSCD